MIKFPETVNEIYVVGDLHGNLEFIKYKVRSLHLHDCIIIICGDIGLGFSPIAEMREINCINKLLKTRNIYVVALRGNHDDPKVFIDDSIIYRNWLNIPDYTILNVLNKNILCVGGGTSIDRKWRIANNIGYWPDEKVIYQEKLEIPIHIVCSHISPSFCYPLVKGQIVDYYAQEDPDLIMELDEERLLMDKIFKDYESTLTHWYYGHYHANYIEIIDNVKYTLLGCETFAQHYE